MSQKKILIIAGPNGAGKTTFAREFLPQEASCPTFVNADLIAAGFSPFAPEVAAMKAGRLMLQEIRSLASAGSNFAFETTLSGRGYVRLLRDWRSDGYEIKLFFLLLAKPEEAIARVTQRVAQGGHHVPDEVVCRRFHAGLQNFKEIYRYEVDFWHLYDNSSEELTLIDEGARNE